MKKIKKELIEKKFEKLSSINKIRYNLGNIMIIQCKSLLSSTVLGFLIFGLLLCLPLVIKYGDLSIVVLLSVSGFMLMIITLILILVGNHKMDKADKTLEEFLNKNDN